ncbi:hypothetical protein BBJ29_001814 [Phytophthora kernoviae]|uniref:C2H2-type domain-containing protein n=1 Tax=Phytophthora kernoviae TaxID=325452 RepID=A0A3F2RR12_9STRA|nr:hypothetical protein BBJ29_001814 [Phytophthora kernoviae]RLN62607.1 hypothetical protein BBP00_00004623 [Phytophthora kernoviae]
MAAQHDSFAIQQNKLSPAHKVKAQAASLKRPLDSQQRVRRPAIHACPQPGCIRRFNRKYTLAEHIKTHTGERPHVCPVRTCGKRFSTSGNLSRHKRLHGYIEPLKCPVQDCICTFPSNNKLEKHMKFHYGGAVKVCVVPGCGKTFSTTGNLNRHLKHQHLDLPAIELPVPQMITVPQMTPQQVPVQQQFLLPPYGQQMPQAVYSPTRSCSDLFEDVWNPELLDTLVTVLHDPTVSC